MTVVMAARGAKAAGKPMRDIESLRPAWHRWLERLTEDQASGVRNWTEKAIELHLKGEMSTGGLPPLMPPEDEIRLLRALQEDALAELVAEHQPAFP